MIDSTNPRILANNIRALTVKSQELSDAQIAQAAELAALGAYSSDEVNTGMKYGDFDIYRKTFEVNNPVIGELTTIAHGVSNLSLVFDCHGVAQTAPGFSGKNVPYSTNILITFNGTNIEYNITSGQSAIKKLIIIFEYTKSASPSPDLSTAPDDSRSIEPEIREEAPEEEPVVEVKKTTRKKTTNE